MKSILEKLLDQLLKHGLLVTLLSLLSYVYWTQNKSLLNKIEQCNQSIIELYREQNDRLLDTLEQNTIVLEKLSTLLENR